MSKVYEALRQKQNELSGAQPPAELLYEEFVDNIDVSGVNLDAGMHDGVLRTAFKSDDEEVKKDLSVGRAQVETEPSYSRVSTRGLKRLSLAKAETSRLVFLTDPHGRAAEQFRFLRRTLEQKFPKGAVLLITSPAPRDGKTLTSINLSSCLGDSGKPTLLLEGDIRQPAIKRVLGTSIEGPGIEDALAGLTDPEEPIWLVEELKFQVSIVQHPPADPSNVVSGSGTKRYLTWARERFHWVVIDSPPVLPAVDVVHLSALADAVLLVVRAQSTPRDLLTRSFEMLGDRLSGVVLNEATVESNPYYRYLSDYRQKPESSRRPVPSVKEKD